MWRGGRCLRPLLGWTGREAAAAAGCPRGAKRSAEAVCRVAAAVPPSTSRPASLGLRGFGSLVSSEQPVPEADAAAEQRGFPEEDGTEHEPLGRPDPGPSRFSFETVMSLLRQENAKDICAIQLPPEMKYCNYFVIVSGSSSRHLHAMAHYLVKMYKHLKMDCDPHVVIEGKETDDWLCIDFGHTVVHFMLPETREVYELEKLWTLRSYDDQLAQMVPESLPDNFTFGMTSEQEELFST